jgi:hypothetical protein
MIKITFPDGSVREYEQGVTGFQIAESISPALARNVVSCGVNGETVELNRPINEDATIALYKFEDEEGSIPSGTLPPTCWQRRYRSCIQVSSSVSDRLWKTDSFMM